MLLETHSNYHFSMNTAEHLHFFAHFPDHKNGRCFLFITLHKSFEAGTVSVISDFKCAVI